MKLELALIAALALAAGPAAAQVGFGSTKPKTPPASYGLPGRPAAPAYGGATTSRVYSPPATPKAEPFKPYQPYKPNSVFGPDGQKKR